MSNVTLNAQSIAKLLVDNKLPTASSVDVFSYTYTGLMSGMDFFGTSGPSEIIHPTYDLMGQNDYLSAIREMPKLTESLDVSVTPNRVIVVRDGTSGSADVKQLQPYEPEIIGFPNLAMTLTEEENPHWSSKGDASYHKKFTPLTRFGCTSAGISAEIGVGVIGAGTNVFVSLYHEAHVGKSTVDRRSSLYYKRPVFNLPDGVYAVPEIVTRGDSELANVIAASGFLRMPVVRRLGLRVEHRPSGVSNTPFVAGTRRFLIVTANGVKGQFLFLSGYILGEGPDLIYYQFALEDEGNGWDVFYSPVVAGIAQVLPEQPYSAGNMRQSSAVQVNRYFAFSWNADFVDTIFGELTTDAETEERLEGDVVVRYHSRSLLISKIVGRVRKDAYREYLSTGYGIFTPKKKEEVDLIMQRWSKIADSVSYTCGPVVIDQTYTLKNTTAYREYGKRRAKACKTNNFLDLAYNQEYPMKTVENKLTALKNLAVLAVDSREVGTIKQKVKNSVAAVTTIATVSKLNDLQFSFVTNTGLSGTKALTEAGVSEFLDAVMPASFAGDVAMLELALGASLTEFAADASGYDVSEVRLDLQGVFIPSHPDWEVMLDTLSIDERTAFLCTQLTDYRQFEASLPKLIRQFMGDKMYPALLSKFELPVAS